MTKKIFKPSGASPAAFMLPRFNIYMVMYFSFFVFRISAQFDGNNSTIKFHSNPDEKSLFEVPEESPFLKGDFLNKPLDISAPKNNNPKINMENQEKFLDPGDYYLTKLKGEKGEGDKNPNNYKSNQYLGDYRVEGDDVRIIFRDHEYPDGDRVRILHNDDVIRANVLLVERFMGLVVELVPGFNKIDFIALNQGASGPNTAEVRVYDEAGNLTAANQWNLATGVKATFIIVKE
jgi:hypothetical protein